MKLHANLAEPVVLRWPDLPWSASPSVGVDRRMLDRDGEEVARATSIVRYAAGSSFPTHVHGAGEEFLVLEGVFEDEHGAYPPGTYVRNPWGTSHAPASKKGCTIFVKLRQMHPEDQTQLVVLEADAAFAGTDEPGVEAAPLHHFGSERVAWERWAPGAAVDRALVGGAELLLLDGTLEDERGRHEPGTWLRLPDGHRHRARSAAGARLWIKRGHLGR